MIYKIVNPDTLVIEHSYEANEPVQYGGPWGSYPHLPTPEGLGPDCLQVTIVEDVITLSADSAKVAAKAAADKVARIVARRALMLADIATGTYQTYGTTSETSALTFHLTFASMVASPSKWVGSLYVDEAAVLAYATPKLAASEAFGLVRMSRIAQYQAEANAILAE